MNTTTTTYNVTVYGAQAGSGAAASLGTGTLVLDTQNNSYQFSITSGTLSGWADDNGNAFKTVGCGSCGSEIDIANAAVNSNVVLALAATQKKVKGNGAIYGPISLEQANPDPSKLVGIGYNGFIFGYSS